MLREIKGAGVPYGCEPLFEDRALCHWKNSQCPLKKQPVFLTADPAFQSSLDRKLVRTSKITNTAWINYLIWLFRTCLNDSDFSMELHFFFADEYIIFLRKGHALLNTLRILA